MPSPHAWYAFSKDETARTARTTADGLTTAEAGRRLAEDGPNLLPRGKTEGPLALLWRQVNNPLIWVLVGSSGLALSLGKGVDAGVVLGVVVLNAIIGFVQEWKAGKALAALEGMVPDVATVRRGGTRTTVPAAELVAGDIVLLASGDKVPADLRLVAVRNLQVTEAALTGESLPVSKETAALSPGTPRPTGGTWRSAGPSSPTAPRRESSSARGPGPSSAGSPRSSPPPRRPTRLSRSR